MPGMHSYHHGDLRQALIAATETLLAEQGPESFSLREAARRAGVSPAAPAHHFGDSSGLLTAVATQGFEGLAQALREGEERGGKDARRRLREQGIAYVQYAIRYPGRFRLMFSHALLRKDPDLQRAGNEAFLVLENGVRAAFAAPASAALSPEAWSAVLALWSVVHGYAHLAIAGRLEPLQCKPRGKAPADVLAFLLDRVIDGCVPRKAKR